jgi:cobalt-zinc-cadmium efflux system outer membrane protein
MPQAKLNTLPKPRVFPSLLFAALSAVLSLPAPAAAQALSLQQAEALFAARNRELLNARRLAESAEADVISAAAPPNPALAIATSRISPAIGIGAGRLTDKRVDTVIGLSQLIERGNKRELRTGAAQFNAAAARSDEADIRRQLRYQLHAAYFDLALAQERLQVAESGAALLEQAVAAAERRLKAGDIAETELQRIRVEALRVRNEARQAASERERAQLALAYLIGMESSAAKLSAADPWPEITGRDTRIAAEALIERRADVRAALARASAAEKARDLARALRTRDVTAGIQYERFPGDTANNSYGFAVSIPLFTRYQYAGEIRRAEVELLAAQEQVERVRALALAEIRRAESELDAAAERSRRASQQLLPASAKAAAGAEFAYSRGAIGVMDLLDARRQHHAARLEAAGATADHARALAAWRSAALGFDE